MIWCGGPDGPDSGGDGPGGMDDLGGGDGPWGGDGPGGGDPGPGGGGDPCQVEIVGLPPETVVLACEDATPLVYTLSYEGDAFGSPMWTVAGASSSDPTQPTIQLEITDPGTVSVGVTITPPDGAPCSADAELEVVRPCVDLAIDSNNDGVIDEQDDEVEDDAPGHVFLLNDDDDDMNGVADLNDPPGAVDEDLTRIVITPGLEPDNPGASWWKLVFPPKIKVYRNDDRTEAIETGVENDWPPPESLYVEGVAASQVAGDVTVTLTVQADDLNPLTDSVRLTVARLSIHDLRHWGPTWDPATGLAGIENMNLDDDIPDSEVGGAITDGASICLIRLTPDLGLSGQLALQVVKSGDTFVNAPNAIGAIVQAGPGHDLPELPLPQDPIGSGYSSDVAINSQKAFFVPPDSYLDPLHNPGVPVTLNSLESARIEFQLFFATDTGGAVGVGGRSFLLRRPPIVLVHGLMGSAQNYWGPAAYSEQAGLPVPTRLYFADYSPTNTDGYPENFMVVRESIRDAMEDYRTANDGGHHPDRRFNGVRYAATRADIVAHSLGGQLVRLYVSSLETNQAIPRAMNASSPPAWRPIVVLRRRGVPGQPDYDPDYYRYLRDDNWGASDIRRFIPIGSPFKGSPIANALAPYLEPTTRNLFLMDSLINRARRHSPALAYQISNLLLNSTNSVQNYRQPTAVQDLAVGSDMQTLLENPAIYPTAQQRVAWHPMVGIATVPASGALAQTAMWELLFTIAPLIPNRPFQIEPLHPTNSDLVVSQWSQRNALNASDAPNNQFPSFSFHTHTFGALVQSVGLVQESESVEMSWAGIPTASSIAELLSTTISRGNMFVGTLD